MILITGANGTFGSQVANILINKGANIRLASSNLDKLKAAYDGNAELVAFNWDDDSSYVSILKGITTAYLIAPPFSTGFDVKTENFTVEAKKAGVKHIVLTTAYGMDQAVGSSGYKSEQVLINSGLDYTILRPNFIFQNFINYDLETINNGMIFYPTGDGATSYNDVRDVAAVSAEILLNPSAYAGEEMTITGSQALTHEEMASIFSKVLGKQIKYVDPSEEEYKTTLKNMGVPAQVYDFMAMLYQNIKAGYMAEKTNVIKEVTGRNPKTFEEFVTEHKELFVREYANN